MTDKRSLPDVSEIDQRRQYARLDWVGMHGIHLPTRLADSTLGEQPIQAHIQSYVNLENQASRGIHMSRLFLQLEQSFTDAPVNRDSLTSALKGFLNSHADLSSRAFIELSFDYSIKRRALKSDNAGWKTYPTTVTASWQDSAAVIELSVDVPYSSTCPASAALARQLIQDAFLKEFGGAESVSVDQINTFLGSTEGIVATPHSQRSIAQVKVKLASHSTSLPLTQLIDQIEDALQTPVQTAVKREDEQEFARLNGQNLMFCEDAARRLKTRLDSEACYSDYWVRVNHLESLHAHDAVAIVTKELPDGYLPIPGKGIS